MIQVFLEHDCPHCGRPMDVAVSVLYATRNIPQYKDTYDRSVFFDVDVIKDNAEAYTIIELCRRYNLDYHVWDTTDYAETYGYEEFMVEFFDDSKAIEDLEWLAKLVWKGFRTQIACLTKMVEGDQCKV